MPLNDGNPVFGDFYPGFTVTCDKCGSTNVYLENSLGWSSESGGWGSIDLICSDCENSTSIHEN